MKSVAVTLIISATHRRRIGQATTLLRRLVVRGVGKDVDTTKTLVVFLLGLLSSSSGLPVRKITTSAPPPRSTRKTGVGSFPGKSSSPTTAMVGKRVYR